MNARQVATTVALAVTLGTSTAGAQTFTTDDPVLRQRLAALYCESEVLRLNRLRTLSARLAGRTPGAEASIQKAMSDEHGQHVLEAAKDLCGAEGMLEGSGPAGELAPSSRTGTTEESRAWASVLTEMYSTSGTRSRYMRLTAF